MVRNTLAIIGLMFLVYHFSLLKHLTPFWSKMRKDPDIQKVERQLQPAVEGIKSDLGISTPQPSPSSAPTTSPSSANQKPKYGANLNFEIRTPIGKVESGWGVSPDTRKDLGSSEQR